ncbi:hypothetical protein WOLCODRAFT_152776 [Wolfiporia cocos MD-104 SS10]|uniref:Glutaminase A N-terminal domain-containing protein n=1 Tax=Wolfiporia cocos (strain MD-104) TaxID=742152 RepID=A0A2H3JML3_WOLCO|nr:hypothetical protein WOLCODRAFT_152776 [Wolfiporia cocos MD-104 SS10]
MLRRLILHFVLFVLVSPILSQNVAPQTFWPAALPLAVRTPYLNAWQPTDNGTTPLDIWPYFWNYANGPLGWAGHIKVDNTTYRWLGGDPGDSTANLTSVQVTLTRTIYYVTAGTMDLRITFLSPIETSGQAEDGNVYYAMSLVSGTTFQTGRDQDIRGSFETNGSLLDTQDTDYRAINDDFPVFAIAVDLGLITTTANPVVWALGYVRNPVIQYTTPTGESQLRYPYWATQYSSISDVINEVLSDFNAALGRATDLDNQVMAATSNISTNYTDIVHLGARQTFAGIDITVSKGTDGAWNMSDVKIFMKNVGTDR